MDNETKQSEPLDIEVFLPQSVELVDRQRAADAYYAASPQRFNSRRRLTLFLFLATCVSTFLAGMEPGGGLAGPLDLFDIVRHATLDERAWAVIRQLLINGATFSASVMLILMCHEMGHYLQSRRYGVPATLPFFIPMPISPFGTMGAVIVQGAGVADRKSLFDIAISGPLAGLVAALPITYFGLLQSTIAERPPGAAVAIYGDPLLLTWMNTLMRGPLPPNADIQLNPMLFAGWVGIFITALNLIPIGQLDGGHILYTLIGKRAHQVAMLLLWGSAAYMILTGNISYIFILVLLFVFGAKHPPTANDRAYLSVPRKILGWATLCFIFIGFTPEPLRRIAPDEEQPPTQKTLDPDDLVHDASRPMTPILVGLDKPRSQAQLGNAL